MADLSDLQHDWDSQPTYSEEKINRIAQLVQSRSDSLRATLLKRDMVEAAAALFIIVCFAPALCFVPGLLAKTGTCIVIFGAVEIVALMNWVRRRGRTDFAALPLKEFLASEVRSLDRQIALLRYVAWWYLLPLYAGACLLVIGLVFAVGDNPLSPGTYVSYVFSIGFCSGYFLFCVFVWWLNQHARKTQLQPLRDVMQRTYDSVTAMGSPDDEADLMTALADPKLDLRVGQFGGSLSAKVTWAISLLVLVAIAIIGAGWSTSFAFRAYTNQQATAHFHDAASVDELVNPMIESGDFKGMSVGIVAIDADGNLRSETFHYGLVDFQDANDNPPRLPDDQTLYEVGGLTKVMTGVLLASAAERGVVSLTTPLAELVPPGVVVPSYGNRKISLLDIMTDRSGLPRLPDNMPLSNWDDPYDDYTPELAESFLGNYQLKVAPGTKHEYSNFAPSYLGHVLTRVAGESDYDALLRQRLTGPLGMLHTKVVIVDEKRHLPIGYTRPGNPASAWHFAGLPGAGGIRSSIEDMNRFMTACLQPPEGEIGRAIDLAFQKHVNPIGSDHAMGLGWKIGLDQSTRRHNGATYGFRSAMFVNRRLKIGVCVLSNTSNATLDDLAERVFQIKSKDSDAQTVINVAREAQIQVSREILDRYVGRYQLQPDFVFHVRRKGDQLLVGVTNQPTYQVYARSETEWFYKVVDASLVFSDLQDGRTQSLTLQQNGIEQTAKRIDDE